jgi:hypothetical protein
MRRSRSWRRPTRPMRWPASDLQSRQVHPWVYYRSAPRDQAVPVLREKMLLGRQRSPAEFLHVAFSILLAGIGRWAEPVHVHLVGCSDATGNQPCLLALEPTEISGIQRQAVASADIVHFADHSNTYQPVGSLVGCAMGMSRTLPRWGSWWRRRSPALCSISWNWPTGRSGSEMTAASTVSR